MRRTPSIEPYERPPIDVTRSGTEPADDPLDVESSSRGRSDVDSSFNTPPGSRTCTLVVVDPTDQPIAGAQASLLAPSESAQLGSTDDRGELHVSADRVAARTILVTHSAFASQRVQVAHEPPARIRVELTAGAAVSGRVVDASGLPVPEPCWVVAWKDGYTPSLQQVRFAKEQAGDEDIAIQPVDRDGRFEIPGLQRGTAYTISAASEHALCVQRRAGVLAPHASIELRVDSVYGVVARLTEVGGSPLRASSLLFDKGPSWECADPESRSLSSVPSEAGVTSWGSLAMERFSSQHDRQLLFVRRTRSERIEPIRYSLEIPGYVPITTDLDAELMSGTPAVRTIALTPLASDFGVLRTQFTGIVPELRTAMAEDNVLGLVFLLDERAHTLSFAIRARDIDGYELDGIPFGDYRVWFEVRCGAMHFPLDGRPLELTVAERAASFTGDLARSGGAILDVVESDGRPYWGAMQIRVDDLREDDTFFDGFGRAPYVLPALPPVNSRVTLVELPGIDAKSVEPADVSITSQRVSRATFRLPPR